MIRDAQNGNLANIAEHRALKSRSEANIEQLCERASTLISSIYSGADIDNDQLDEECGDVFDDLGYIANQLSGHTSNALGEIAAKVQVWKAIANEDIFLSEKASTDERLLLSIIRDIEALNTRSNGPGGVAA